MIDTHAHLTGNFCKNTDKVIEGSLKKGVGKIILAASNVRESRENIELSKKHPGVLFPAVGIHPQQTDVENFDSPEKQLKQIEELIEKNKDLVVGVGETGLDYSSAPEGEKDRTKEEQQKLFEGQLKLAAEYQLPVIIHGRKAVDEVIETVDKFEKKYGPQKGVFHCYAGGKKRIKRILDLSGKWYFGVNGNLTYDPGLEEVLKEIPLDRLVLETDSPFLSPVPHREEMNEPGNVELVYKKVAGVLKKDSKKIEEVVDGNAEKLFSI